MSIDRVVFSCSPLHSTLPSLPTSLFSLLSLRRNISLCFLFVVPLLLVVVQQHANILCYFRERMELRGPLMYARPALDWLSKKKSGAHLFGKKYPIFTCRSKRHAKRSEERNGTHTLMHAVNFRVVERKRPADIGSAFERWRSRNTIFFHKL